MPKWKSFGGRTYSKPKKSLKQLQDEVDKLKEARKRIDAYEKLQKEHEAIQQEIKKEGFKIRHRKALGIINTGISIGKGIRKKTSTGIKNVAKTSAPYLKKGYKEYRKYKKSRKK